MKLKFIVAVLLASFVVVGTSEYSFSGPASPDIIEAMQPNGDTFKAVMKGDEYQNWIETTAGYTVIKNDATGFYEYAVLDPQTENLTPSGFTLKPAESPPFFLKKT